MTLEEDAQWQATEGLSVSLQSFVPLKWDDIINETHRVSQRWFKYIARLLSQGRYDDRERMHGKAWFKALRSFSWGALHAKYEGIENNFSTADNREDRLAEISLTGPVVWVAVHRARILSKSWPDDFMVTGKDIDRREQDIQTALHEIGEAWIGFAYGNLDEQSQANPVRPCLEAVKGLLDRRGEQLSRMGIEFLERALPSARLG